MAAALIPLTSQRARLRRARFAAAAIEVAAARLGAPEALPLNEAECLLFENALRAAWRGLSLTERTKIRLFIRDGTIDQPGCASEALWLLESPE